MKSVAIICPVHKPKFDYARQCLESFYRHNLNMCADFYFVFGSEEEAKEFGGFERFLIMPSNMMFGNTIPIKKKLWAMNEIREHYKYAIAIDADFAFIKSVNLLDVCDEFFEKKIVIFNDTTLPDVIRINRSCISHFRNNPKSIQLDARWYSWLNQPCIYRLDTMEDFFNKIDVKDDLNAFIWEDFDYVMYAYYLILYLGFKAYIIPDWPEYLSPFGEIGEVPSEFDFNIMDSVNFWVCSKKAYNGIQMRKPHNKIFLVVHMDRG